MRKITLLLASLFITIGAMAQVTTPVDGVYTIGGGTDANNRGKLAAGVGYPNYPVLSNIQWSDYSGNSATPIDNGEVWYVKKNGEGLYYIYNIGLGKFLYNPKSGNQITFSDTPYAWEILVNSSNNSYNSIYDLIGTYLCFACGKNAANKPVHFNNQADDGGSFHTFTAIENGTTTYATQIENADNAIAEKIATINYNITDVTGVVYTGNYLGIAGVTEPALNGNNYTFSETNWDGNNFTAKVQFTNPTFPLSGSNKLNDVIINPFGYDYMFYKVDGTQVKATKTVPTEGTLKNYLWAIYPLFKSTGVTYIIKNIATDKYIYTTSTTNSHDNGVVTVAENATAFTLESDNKFKCGGGKYLSTGSSTSNESNAGTWGSHNGVKNTIHREVKSYILTDSNTGNKFEGEYAHYNITNLKPAFKANATGITFSNEALTTESYAADVTFPLPVSKEGEVPNATLLSIFASASEPKYWHAIGEDIKIQTASANPVDLNCLWAVYPIFNNYGITYVIKNIAADRYVYSEASESKLGQKGTVVLNNIATHFSIVKNGQYPVLKFTDKQLYLSINSTNDTDTYLGVHGGIHGGVELGTPILTTFNATVGEAGYATLYTPWEITIPATSPVTAHAVTVDGEWAKLGDALTTIPANTGVVLKGAGTITFNISNTNASALENNMMDGTAMKTKISKENGTYYVLWNDTEKGVGFYNPSNGEEETGDFTNSAYKAYLHIPAVSGVSFYNILLGDDDEENTTAIENVETATVNVIYDLSGRRVETITAPGIYVVNGRKMLVK